MKWPRVALASVAALVLSGCTAAMLGWTTPDYAGRLVPVSQPEGQRRLELEIAYDPMVAWFTRGTRGRPGYIHVVDTDNLVLVYPQRDEAVTFRRKVTTRSDYEIASAIPPRLFCQMAWEDQLLAAEARGSTPCPRPPKGVRLDVGARIARVPFTPAELEDPTFQASIAACEQIPMYRGGCRSSATLEQPRSRFSRGEKLAALLSLYGLEPNRHYDVLVRLFALTRDALVFRQQIGVEALEAPPDRGWFQISVEFEIGRDAPIGPWRLEVIVNGRMEMEQSIEIAAR